MTKPLRQWRPQIVTTKINLHTTNFDHWIDYVTLSIWIVGLIDLLGAGLILKDTKSSIKQVGRTEDSTPKMDADEDEMEIRSNESKQEVD